MHSKTVTYRILFSHSLHDRIHRRVSRENASPYHFSITNASCISQSHVFLSFGILGPPFFVHRPRFYGVYLLFKHFGPHFLILIFFIYHVLKSEGNKFFKHVNFETFLSHNINILSCWQKPMNVPLTFLNNAPMNLRPNKMNLNLIKILKKKSYLSW